jgi:ADP-ribose pyrophosphatase
MNTFDPKAPTFVRESEHTVFQGHFIKVVSVDVRVGDEVINREYIVHPGAVTVVPVTADGFAVVLWQYRAAMGREILEVCAGKRDKPGEAPELTAARELDEEMGLQANTIRSLGRFFNSPGFCDEETHMFLATELTQGARHPEGPEERAMRFGLIDLFQVSSLIDYGVLTDAKTVLSLERAARTLEMMGVLGDPGAIGGATSHDLGFPYVTRDAS